MVAALAFIDQELEQQVPKSKVAYLIRAEQQEMKKDTLEYIAALPEPQLAFADSAHFQQEVERVTAKLNAPDKAEAKQKKKAALTDLPKKLV